ncbi:flavodoxin family protein [Lacrimispora algidixylanolytica]|uniref:Flavodoxin n=1 Tax=Lacrimispora algidixylanolytica TaxID=94868 RepID=A0A419TBV6_9FIRM|nr:flavodoxin family protein [Lacrimispora algidixylanolytica]RKD34969.1 flavodoxin [Lacrimispora algidixylanolytica]
MNVLAVNGSPRKNENTAVLLQNAIRGAEENGAETRLVNLYELNFKGCVSCFACKRKGSDCNGVCAVRDDLKEVFEYALSCDVILLGSPIYFGNVTGEMRSFLERLLFPILTYNKGERSIFRGTITSGFIYTMNVPKDIMEKINYDAIFKQNQQLLQLFHGNSEILLSNDTYQFHDYSKYDASSIDESHKAKVKKEQFPIDCQSAFDLGVRLTNGIKI